MTKDNAMTNRVQDRTVSKTERVVIPKEYDDGFDVVPAPDGQPAIVERSHATPERIPEPMRYGCFAVGLVFMTEREAQENLKTKGISIIRCQCEACKTKRERINA